MHLEVLVEDQSGKVALEIWMWKKIAPKAFKSFGMGCGDWQPNRLSKLRGNRRLFGLIQECWAKGLRGLRILRFLAYFTDSNEVGKLLCQLTIQQPPRSLPQV